VIEAQATGSVIRSFTRRMGLDDLPRLQHVLPLLALMVTVLVSGPATLLSYGAWRWSLARLAQGHRVGGARVGSVVALALTGLPTAYSLALVAAIPGLWGVAELLVVLALALLALVHAAFRDETIRAMNEDPALSEKLAALDVWERAAWLRGAGRAALPTFAGTTKRRTLKHAAMAGLVWFMPFAILPLARG
jgi:hypothetical protein